MLITSMLVVFEFLIDDVEKLHAQTSWGDKGNQNKDVLPRHRMSDMRPCSATDRQIGSD